MVTIWARSHCKESIALNAPLIFTRLSGRPLGFYTHALEQMGYDPERILHNAGIPARPFKKGKGLIPTAQTFAFIREAIEDTGIPALGLILGRRIRLADFGILGFAMESSDNLWQATSLLSAYHEISGGFLAPHLQAAASGEVSLSYQFHVPDDEYRYFFMEEMLTAYLAIAEELTQVKTSYREVYLDYPEPDHAEQYLELLGECSVHFSAGKNEVVLDRAGLDLPCRNRDPETCFQCERVCEKLQQELKINDSLLIGKIRKMLHASHGAMPHRDEVARALNMSTRTLSRKLARLDTNYQSVIDEFRAELAKMYLETTNFSVEAICALVGFADRSSFIRAFRRWTGNRPSAYRSRNGTPS